jgi:hypothetical protein
MSIRVKNPAGTSGGNPIVTSDGTACVNNNVIGISEGLHCAFLSDVTVPYTNEISQPSQVHTATPSFPSTGNLGTRFDQDSDDGQQPGTRFDQDSDDGLEPGKRFDQDSDDGQ